jgi:hypothetical protein
MHPDQDGNPKARSSDYWDFFIADCIRLNAPLYRRLSEGTRADAELCALAALARPGQPPANMLFGAVHYMLLRGADHALRQHYRTLSDATPDGDPFPLFRAFCLAQRDSLARLIAQRVTNTNEVGRCAFLHPAFVSIAAEAGEPLHLIDLGASAGLNLAWDVYGYRYRQNGTSYRAGKHDSELVLESRIGDLVPPLGPTPRIGMRVGIELNPVDLGSAEDRDWLRALVWPDHPERLQRLERAIAICVKRPPDIRVGDALELLPDIAAKAPRDGALCIVHTMTTYQFSEQQRAALEDMMMLISLRRPVWRLGMEWDRNAYPLTLTCYRDGARSMQILAHSNGHGGELEWYPPAAAHEDRS